MPFAQEAPYTVTLNGVLASIRFDANEGIDGTWNERALRLNLDPGLYALVFSPADIAGPLPAQDRFIDKVSLVASVPLPGALCLLSSALGGIGLVRRRGVRGGD